MLATVYKPRRRAWNRISLTASEEALISDFCLQSPETIKVSRFSGPAPSVAWVR